MRPFTYQALPAQVIFGPGTLARVAEVLGDMGARRALVLSTPGQRALAGRVCALLGPLAAGRFDQAVMHVPVETVRQAAEVARTLRADSTVAVGGGSTTGLAKALALETGLPILAIPTTYAGSEMTPIHGITEAGLKKTGRDLRVLPARVIYDPVLGQGLPSDISVTSGINAIAHAAEGLYAAGGNPVIDLMAEEGIAALGRALPAIVADPNDLGARGDALYGAWLCGTVLGSVGMALHHKLCHTLGGSFNLPHAPTHTAVLPHALAYNAAAAPQAMQRIARALGREDGQAPRAVFELAHGLGASMALRDLGLRADDLDRACALALQTPYPNPRPLEAGPLRALLQAAWAGEPPPALT